MNGHLCKDTKLDNMNTRLLERNNNNETAKILNPRPVNSISLDNKPVSVKLLLKLLILKKIIQLIIIIAVVGIVM